MLTRAGFRPKPKRARLGFSLNSANSWRALLLESSMLGPLASVRASSLARSGTMPRRAAAEGHDVRAAQGHDVRYEGRRRRLLGARTWARRILGSTTTSPTMTG